MDSKENKRDDTYDAEFKRYFWIFCCAVIIVCILPPVLTRGTWGVSIGTSDPNEIGDAIGGTLGPLVALLASGLTFLAFWVQYKANQQQRKDIRIERFENRFYEMLRLHNETAKEINTAGGHSGRKAFVYLFAEFWFVYKIVENELGKWNSRSEINKESSRLNYTGEDLAKFAYKMFFFGVGEQSDKATTYVHGVDKDFYKEVRTVLQRLKDDYRKQSGSDVYVKLIYSSHPAIAFGSSYLPFDGHVSRLGHYYRHLYQTVKYVDSQNDLDDKHSFMVTLRAQLSNHEQLLLYYNSFSFPTWWEEGLFLRSRIVKNIPLYLADIGPRPQEKFAEVLKKSKPGITKEALDEELRSLLEWYKPKNLTIAS